MLLPSLTSLSSMWLTNKGYPPWEWNQELRPGNSFISKDLLTSLVSSQEGGRLGWWCSLPRKWWECSQKKGKLAKLNRSKGKMWYYATMIARSGEFLSITDLCHPLNFLHNPRIANMAHEKKTSKDDISWRKSESYYLTRMNGVFFFVWLKPRTSSSSKEYQETGESRKWWFHERLDLWMNA